MKPGQERLTRKEHLVLVIRTVLYFFVMIPAVFLCAGRLSYWQGWAFFGFTGIYIVFTYFHLSSMPGLVRERMRPGPGAKKWDRALLSLYAALSLGLVFLSALDAGRGWTGRLPVWVYAVGWLTFLSSYGLASLAMSVNPWFSSVVRIQADRGQRVVTEGPYRIVRHPGYVGGIGGALATPIVLGSLWGLVGTGLIAIVLICRTWLEDRTLIRELPGYADYTRQVRWRLMPGVW